MMSRKRHTAEQIISKLREAEVLLAKGTKIPQLLIACERPQIGQRTQCGTGWRGAVHGDVAPGQRHPRSEAHPRLCNKRRGISGSKNGSSRIQGVVQNRARVGVLMCSSRLCRQLPFGLTCEVGIPLGLRANHYKKAPEEHNPIGTYKELVEEHVWDDRHTSCQCAISVHSVGIAADRYSRPEQSLCDPEDRNGQEDESHNARLSKCAENGGMATPERKPKFVRVRKQVPSIFV